jgi:hypothetical protein
MGVKETMYVDAGHGSLIELAGLTEDFKLKKMNRSVT